jgi:hypothetical protein
MGMRLQATTQRNPYMKQITEYKSLPPPNLKNPKRPRVPKAAPSIQEFVVKDTGTGIHVIQRQDDKQAQERPRNFKSNKSKVSPQPYTTRGRG